MNLPFPSKRKQCKVTWPCYANCRVIALRHCALISAESELPLMIRASLSCCCSVLLFKFSRKFGISALYWYPLLISGFLRTFSKVNFVNIFSFPLQKFIEEKKFLAQLDTSFQKCEEMYKNLGKVSLLLFNDMAIVSRRYLFYFNGLEINFSHACFLGEILAFCS